MNRRIRRIMTPLELEVYRRLVSQEELEGKEIAELCIRASRDAHEAMSNVQTSADVRHGAALYKFAADMAQWMVDHLDPAAP